MSRALHLEVTKAQRAEEFKEKLNFYYLKNKAKMHRVW